MARESDTKMTIFLVPKLHKTVIQLILYIHQRCNSSLPRCSCSSIGYLKSCVTGLYSRLEKFSSDFLLGQVQSSGHILYYH